MTASDQKRSPGLTLLQELCFAHPQTALGRVAVTRLTELRAAATLPPLHEPMRLDFHLLQLVLDGAGSHLVDFEEVALASGTLLHVRPGQVQAFSAEASHDGIVVLFRAEAVDHPLPLQLTYPHRSVSLRPDPSDFELLVDLAEFLERLSSQGKVIRGPELGCRVLGALVTALEHVIEVLQPYGPTASPAALELVQGFGLLLEQQLTQGRSVAWFASSLGVSVRTLSRACESVLGSTAKQHRDTQVALEAKRRLIFSTDTVDVVSTGLGFSEPTNFSKFFRRVTGQTPQAFRHRATQRGD